MEPASRLASPARPVAPGTGKGMLACLAATLSFGLMFPVMASALRHVDPFTFTSLRYLMAAAACTVLLAATEGRAGFVFERGSLRRCWWLGSVGFAGFGFLVFLGQRMAGRDGALSASIMAATQPMLALIVTSVTRRKLPPLPTLGFVVMSFSGVALVITKGDLGGLLNQPSNYGADALILVGMTAWLIYTFGAGRYAHWSALKYTTATMWMGLITIIAINLGLIAGGAVSMPSGSAVLAVLPHLLYMSLIASVVGVFFWNVGNRILTPLNGVLFMDVVPITAFSVSALTGVVPARAQIAGACLTGAALVLNNLYVRRHRPPG